ncbi:MAG TPA: protocatechuate 3,4-dioxygenase subunit alpha [Candidatus Binataceae bacterium]|nr:protocatechuate 3,4-dioxygenase subunit alpha [Candidatus Binataceae bacterium]
MARPTSSQTIGPFFHRALVSDDWTKLASEKTAGEKITITGRVLDGDGMPVSDAMIEIWQANSYGRYNHPDDTHEARIDPTFRGFGRCATDDSGAFRFATVKPGAVPGNGGGLQAPHIGVVLFARGLLKHLHTRIYFPDEALNRSDEWLNAAPEDRRATLIASESTAGSKRVFNFDIVLQGDRETVFFDF